MEQEVKGKTLFKTPLQLRSDQIVLENPEIELVVFKNDETSRKEKIETKIKINLAGTTVIDTISRHKTEEAEKAEEKYRDIVQGLAAGKKKIVIEKDVGGRTSFKVADKPKKS